MQEHLEFQIVTPRTLNQFTGDTLVLPNVRVLDESEKGWLKSYVASGKQLVITGEDATQLTPASNIARVEPCPGKEYMAALEKDFEHTTPDSQAAFLKTFKSDGSIQIAASPEVATSISLVDGKPHVFLANFAGLRGGVNPVQTVQSGVKVTISSEAKGPAFFLPFMGEVQKVQGVRIAGGTSYTLPPISKGAVFWYEPAADRANSSAH